MFTLGIISIALLIIYFMTTALAFLTTNWKDSTITTKILVGVFLGMPLMSFLYVVLSVCGVN